MEKRLVAWKAASELVACVVLEHGLEAYRSGVLMNPQTTITAVDQHIEHIIRVADWLLGDE